MAAGSLSFTDEPGGLLLSFTTTDTPTTLIPYDAIRRVQSVAGPSTTSYSYYLDGTVKSVTDITGTSSFGEDQLGRLASTQDPLNGPTATTAYTLDAGSRLTKRVEASGISTAFTYSALDELTQKTMTASGGTSPFASWSNTYDLAGNRLSEISRLWLEGVRPAEFMRAACWLSGDALVVYRPSNSTKARESLFTASRARALSSARAGSRSEF